MTLCEHGSKTYRTASGLQWHVDHNHPAGNTIEGGLDPSTPSSAAAPDSQLDALSGWTASLDQQLSEMSQAIDDLTSTRSLGEGSIDILERRSNAQSDELVKLRSDQARMGQEIQAMARLVLDYDTRGKRTGFLALIGREEVTAARAVVQSLVPRRESVGVRPLN